MNKLLDSAIDEIERVLLGNKDRSVEEVYMKNAIRFIREFSKQPTLNKNQQIVLEWLKDYYKENRPFTTAFGAIENVASKRWGFIKQKLTDNQQEQVIELFAKWAQEQEEE